MSTWSQFRVSDKGPAAMPYRCTPCLKKGHNCYTDRLDENNQPICVFCEDGEPCIWDRRNKNSQQGELERPQQRPHKPSEAGSTPAPATTPAPRKESPRPPEVQPTAAKPNGDAAKKYCPGYKRECGEVLRPKNTSGFCTKCYARRCYHEKISPKAAKPARQRKLRPEWQKENRAPQAHLADAPPSGSRVTLEVTEHQLNKFLVGLPLAEKQRLANHYLQTAEV